MALTAFPYSLPETVGNTLLSDTEERNASWWRFSSYSFLKMARVKTGIIKGAEARPTEKERAATGVELDQAPGEIRR